MPRVESVYPHSRHVAHWLDFYSGRSAGGGSANEVPKTLLPIGQAIRNGEFLRHLDEVHEEVRDLPAAVALPSPRVGGVSPRHAGLLSPRILSTRCSQFRNSSTHSCVPPSQLRTSVKTSVPRASARRSSGRASARMSGCVSPPQAMLHSSHRHPLQLIRPTTPTILSMTANLSPVVPRLISRWCLLAVHVTRGTHPFPQ